MEKQEYSYALPLDKNAIKRQADGSIVLNAGAFKVGTYEHYGFEVPSLRAGWDDILVGELTQEEAEKMLGQFEGLALTRGHVWIDGLNARKEYAVGTVTTIAELKPVEGEMIAMVRVVITDNDTIERAESGEYSELSIGIKYVPKRVQREGIDFELTNVVLNHLALVKQGRAGKAARLYNHSLKGKNMVELQIAGKAYQVPQEVASYAKQLETDLAAQTVQRQTYEGKADALAAQLATAQTAESKAVELAKEHAAFAATLQKVGYELTKQIGDYDKAAEMKAALTAVGFTVREGASIDYMAAMIDHAKPAEIKPNAALLSKPIEWKSLQQLDQEAHANIRKSIIGVI
jgi:hypothetical protein